MTREVPLELCHRVLESDFLNEKIQAINLLLKKIGEPSFFDGSYILDIDLDYLNTCRSIEPRDSQEFLKLVKNAALVTVATEPDYVQHCAREAGVTSDFLNGLRGFFDIATNGKK